MYPNHLATLVASALLLAPAGATPLVYTQLAGGRYNNKCGAATFRGATSAGSPAAGDCGAVAARYGGFDGGWHMSGLPTDGTYQTLASHGRCAFGVRPRDGGGGAFHSFYVGASDIADLVRDARARFARHGRLGAEGDVQCGGTKLQWAIYRV